MRCTVEYDGTEFHGFQRQASVRTVAGVLEGALANIFGERIAVTGAGRTDAGVHATGQVVSFRTLRAFPAERLAVALNAVLDDDLAVRDVAEAGDDFSARRCALERTYVYAILNRAAPSPLLARYAWHVRRALDLDAMNTAAAHLAGEHDFRSFCALPENGRTVRRLSACALDRRGELVRLQVSADGFLHHMVRAMVGTLVECGDGRRDPASLPAVLAARERRAAGITAPARGLYLAGVRYAEYDSYGEPRVGEVPPARPPELR
ncbi:MAG: tRNA pseudouridine(38-40) synthase TruA [Candidatus Tyrphobacter sp.]